MAYHGPNPDRSQRRVTREQLEASRAAWAAGGFSDEWGYWRTVAARDAGIIDPPSGTRWDSWSDGSPSQRAILVRAMRETPQMLRRAIRKASRPTWEAVIERLLQDRDVLGDDADLREEQWQAAKRAPMAPLTDILAVLRDSLGVER